MDLNELRNLYSQGQTEKVLQQIRTLNVQTDDTEYLEFQCLAAWCHYRRKEFRQALNIVIKIVDKHTPTKIVLAYLYAYAPDYINDKGLKQIADELHNDIDITNALVIRARAQDCDILSRQEVTLQSMRYINHENQLAAANLQNNTARYFQVKARDKDDLFTAIQHFNVALDMYGEETNWHHRAAANYWKSFATEKAFGPQQALEIATKSAELWLKQVNLDPNNESFQQKLKAAEKRVVDLTPTT